MRKLDYFVIKTAEPQGQASDPKVLPLMSLPSTVGGEYYMNGITGLVSTSSN